MTDKRTDRQTDREGERQTDSLADTDTQTNKNATNTTTTYLQETLPSDHAVFQFLIAFQIWMLTGDKLETATCIAQSSRLVARNQMIHTFKQVYMH